MFLVLCQTCMMQRAESLKWSPWQSWHILQECIYDSIYWETFSLNITPTDSLRDTRNSISLLHIHAGLGAHYLDRAQNSTNLAQMTNFRCLQRPGCCAWAVKIIGHVVIHCIKTAYLQICPLQEPKNDSHNIRRVPGSPFSKKKNKIK